MLHNVSGNLVTDKTYDIFCHQTNCCGVMGAGIASQIKNVYPEVAEADKIYCKLSAKEGKKILGTNIYVKTKDGRTCVNMYAQQDYGTNSRKTDYVAFQACLDRLTSKLSISSIDLKIGFPYGVGCGLGGGDWNIICEMISKFASKVSQEVYIVRYNANKKGDC